MTHSNSNPNNSAIDSRIFSAGLYCNRCSENVAYNYSTVDQVMHAWINSPSHYSNIVGNYKYFGYAKFDKKTYNAFSSADTHELPANVAPIALTLDVGVSEPRRIKSYNDVIY
ncbi:hypothetical protein AYI69_g4482 [Smittium culicis]|uniref:SCP domain-containing protein n=1 Tax=Smittium culicis TaxID=133412 RepID=A0A1R1YD96_9FUNG|nr:hypothetical protein AYI69_g4482 [Smittium culicis]